MGTPGEVLRLGVYARRTAVALIIRAAQPLAIDAPAAAELYGCGVPLAGAGALLRWSSEPVQATGSLPKSTCHSEEAQGRRRIRPLRKKVPAGTVVPAGFFSINRTGYGAARGSSP